MYVRHILRNTLPTASSWRHLARRNSPFNAHAFSSSSRKNGPFQLAIIGSGPAGFYSAHKVMQRLPDARVDMYEQLPVPFGLVRFGVAPDHPEVKNCEEKFTEVASSPRFKFFGNVHVGTSVSLKSLQASYDAILFAYGASRDRELGVPGEHLDGIHSARAFVGWYNGLPEFSTLAPDLESSDTAVIIGQGNVALDVARVLLCDVKHLEKTDIAGSALETLRRSRVKHVRVVGRRGPMQAAFTIKEVRELMQLPGVRFEPIDLDLLPPDDLILPRPQKRIAQLLAKHSKAPSDPLAARSLSFDFLLSPTEFRSSSGGSRSLSSVQFRHNAWMDRNNRYLKDAKVLPADDHLSLHTGLAFRSIGYKAEPLIGMDTLGIDFNHRAGRIDNDRGRVLCGGQIARGLYCTGWAKNGPTGVIATTMADAFATAELISQDWNDHVSEKHGCEAVRPPVTSYVDWPGWQRIDRAEKSRGEELGKEREKFTSVQAMLDAA